MPENEIEKVAEYINMYDEVTHNYIREDEYNMWFTMITRSEENLINILEEIKRNTGLEEIMSLPSVKLFKIKVALNLQGDDTND